MQILHTKGFTEDKLRSAIPLLRNNAIDTIKILITACRDWTIEFTPEEQEQAEVIMLAVTLNEPLAQHISVIWNSIAVQKAYQQHHRIQLPGGASTTDYYMEHVQRFAHEDFMPNIADMLRVKFKTIGIAEVNFHVNGAEFLMVDVGGQRSERKKMAMLFQRCLSSHLPRRFKRIRHAHGRRRQNQPYGRIPQTLPKTLWLPMATRHPHDPLFKQIRCLRN